MSHTFRSIMLNTSTVIAIAFASVPVAGAPAIATAAAAQTVTPESAGSAASPGSAALRAQAESTYAARQFAASSDAYARLIAAGSATANDFYNAACSASLAGRMEDAASWLIRSVETGYENYDHLISGDSDLAALRGDPRWQRVLAVVKPKQEAHARYIASLPDATETYNRLDTVGLFPTYLALRDMYDRNRNAPMEWRGNLLQMLGWTQAEIGDPMAAVRLGDEYESKPRTVVPAEFNNFTPADARTEILTRARDTRLVMINEGHHVSQTRVLTREVLSGLYDQGYRYFAVEAIWRDAGMNDRKYATSEMGGYLRDPVFGDMLRHALELGYTLVRYDTFAVGCVPTAQNPAACFNGRDSLAANALHARTFARDVSAKVVVHAGYSHVVERPGQSPSRPLALYLQKMTGIDPLTVDQTQMREHVDRSMEEAVYRAAAGNGWLTKPIVLRTSDSTYYTAPTGGFRGVDMQVFSPRTSMVHDRPDWRGERGGSTLLPLSTLRSLDGRTLYSLVSSLTAPVILQVFRAGEPSNAVPTDQVPMDSIADVALALRRGDYQLVARDSTNAVRLDVRFHVDDTIRVGARSGELPHGLAGAGSIMILGELHGTAEVPAFAATAMEQAVAGRPVILALELPSKSQAALDRYLESRGSDSARDAFLNEEMWQPDKQDGKRSAAVFALIDSARVLKAAGRAVQVLFFDDETYRDSRRDARMAELLAAAHRAAPSAAMIVVTGNVHAKRLPGTPWDSAFVPMAVALSRRLPSASITSLELKHSGGDAWVCAEKGCGNRAFSANSTRLPGVELYRDLTTGFDGAFHV